MLDAFHIPISWGELIKRTAKESNADNVLGLAAQLAYYFLLALVAPIVLAWAWYLTGFARGVWEMRQHVAWGIRSGGEAHDREARIAATKAELEREALLQVRPLPAPPHAPPTSPRPMKPRRAAR